MGTRSYLLSGETPPYPDEADEGQAADAQHAIGDPGPAAATATRHRAETRLGRRAGALRARPGGRALAGLLRVPASEDGRTQARCQVRETSHVLRLRESADQCAGRDDLPNHRVQLGRAGGDRAPRVPGHLDLRARVGRKEDLARVEQAEVALCERGLAADPQRAQGPRVGNGTRALLAIVADGGRS